MKTQHPLNMNLASSSNSTVYSSLFSLSLSLATAISMTLNVHVVQADEKELTSFSSTYKPLPENPVAIINTTILTGTGEQLNDSNILLADGRIVSVGPEIDIPKNATIIDGKEKWVTPGLIDAHSHLGVFPSPSVRSTADGNENTSPNTAHVWAEHSVWPQDPGFYRARNGGVTSLMVLPGSSNLIGGRSVTLKNIPAVTVQQMKFPDAPYYVKMACGENPKNKGRAPVTRMGNMAGFRTAMIDAENYKRKMDDYDAKAEKGAANSIPPKRDLALETLSGVLEGNIAPQIHCYRADEMAQMIDLSKEFGFQIKAFHHAVEGYKIAELLARENIGAAVWANRWGFKLEAYDGIGANAAILNAANVNTVLHSDSAYLIQRLNIEAAIAMAAAQDAGIEIGRAEAIKWVTYNAASLIGIAEQTGSLEAGKMADVVLWSTDPFSIYAHAEKVYIDGTLTFDRDDPRNNPDSDFELGHMLEEVK